MLGFLGWQQGQEYLYGQASVPDSLNLPKVFLIGEFEEQYEMLYREFNDVLLSVCNEDMHYAFDKWVGMISEMEAYSRQIDYDLKGIKLWLKVFWNANGTIRYISYFLKPTSRLIEMVDLNAFMSSFINHYQMSIDSDVPFRHDGSAQFPTFILEPESLKN